MAITTKMHSSIVRLSLFVLVSMFLFGCATGPQPMAPMTQVLPQPVTAAYPAAAPFTHAQTIEHIVGPYETLFRISQTYGVSIDSLMRANGIADPRELKNGQKLVIPDTMGPRPVIPYFPADRWTYIVIHHTATHDGNAFSIDAMHHQRGFWNGLGYHFLVSNGTLGMQSGQIQVGPRWMKQQDGAHANAADMNIKGIGIALIGNFSEGYVDQPQLESLIFLVKTLQRYYDIPSSHVIRHNDVPGKNTECPGTHFPWSDFKNSL